MSTTTSAGASRTGEPSSSAHWLASAANAAAGCGMHQPGVDPHRLRAPAGKGVAQPQPGQRAARGRGHVHGLSGDRRRRPAGRRVRRKRRRSPPCPAGSSTPPARLPAVALGRAARRPPPRPARSARPTRPGPRSGSRRRPARRAAGWRWPVNGRSPESTSTAAIPHAAAAAADGPRRVRLRRAGGHDGVRPVGQRPAQQKLELAYFVAGQRGRADVVALAPHLHPHRGREPVEPVQRRG